MHVKITTNESGDWIIVSCEGKMITQNHDIGPWDLALIIEELGHTCTHAVVTDEQMESMV